MVYYKLDEDNIKVFIYSEKGKVIELVYIKNKKMFNKEIGEILYCKRNLSNVWCVLFLVVTVIRNQLNFIVKGNYKVGFVFDNIRMLLL